MHIFVKCSMYTCIKADWKLFWVVCLYINLTILFLSPKCTFALLTCLLSTYKSVPEHEETYLYTPWLLTYSNKTRRLRKEEKKIESGKKSK